MAAVAARRPPLPARNDLQWKVVSGGFSISVEGLLTGKLTTGD